MYIYLYISFLKIITILFTFQVLSDDNGKRKGIYNHPIIQKAVNKMWFKNKRDEGIIYPDYFNPISVHSIALILTAVGFFFKCNLIIVFFYFPVRRLNVILKNGQLESRQ